MMRKYLYKNARMILLISFFLICLFILVLIIKSLTYFNTEADRSEILKMEETEALWFQPKQTWQNTNAGDSLLIVDLQKDYTQFWAEKFKSEKFQDPSFISFFMDDVNLKNLDPFYKNSDNSYITENYLVAHNPKIKFFSKDGHIAVIEDSAMQFIQPTYHHQKLISKKWLEKTINTTWILSSGTWKLRQMSVESEKAINPYEEIESLGVNKINSSNLENFKGTNYYPQNQAWNNMWLNFQPEIINRDLRLMHDAGLNSVRVFLPYEEFTSENQSAIDNFEIFLKYCEKHQIKAIPTLFDFFGDYRLENYTQADRYLENILSRFKGNPNILAWDLKNEADLDFKNHGENEVMNWLEFIIIRAKQHDPTHAITVGWSNAESARLFSGNLDLISFHFYKKPYVFEKEFQKLKEKIPNKPLAVTEFGQSTYNSFWYPFSKNENAQLSYYQNMFEHFGNSGMTSFMHWTLYDFSEVSDKVVGSLPWRKNIQKHFGFIREDGSEKPAFAVINGDIKNSKKVNPFLKLSKFQITFIVLFLLLVVAIRLFIKKSKKLLPYIFNFKQKFNEIRNHKRLSP